MLLPEKTTEKRHILLQIILTSIILHIFLSNKNLIRKLYMPTLITVTNGQFDLKKWNLLNNIIRMKVADTQVSY